MRLLILLGTLAIGSFAASLARSAKDPLPSIIRELETKNRVGEATIAIDMGQVVGTYGEFVLVRPALSANHRVGSMLPADWYSGYGIR